MKIEVENLLRIASEASSVCKQTILKRHLAYKIKIKLKKVEQGGHHNEHNHSEHKQFLP